jgi:hypothetical protein
MSKKRKSDVLLAWRDRSATRTATTESSLSIAKVSAVVNEHRAVMTTAKKDNAGNATTMTTMIETAKRRIRRLGLGLPPLAR